MKTGLSSNFQKSSKSSIAIPLISAVAFAGLGYILYRYLREEDVRMSPQVADRLPLAKNLQTVGDYDGNYDLDGVSFDSEGTVVGSDANKDIKLQ